MKKFTHHKAINYSGYRQHQSPIYKKYPSKEEILEDLRLLEGEFYYLRLFDCTLHAYRVLELIKEHSLNFKVLLGLFMSAEVNHKNHPFFYVHKEEVLRENKKKNKDKVTEIIELANQYEKIVSAVSIGNETRSIWNNNRISEERLVEVAKRIKNETNAPVTFCEEYQHWVEGLEELASVVDFISLHTYPAWQGSKVENARSVAVKNYQEVQEKYPDKYCIITETGWPTNSHGSKISKEDACVKNQHIYNKEISDRSKENDVLVYLFEAFDEPWKGDKHPDEPEKHWGIYTVDRLRK